MGTLRNRAIIWPQRGALMIEVLVTVAVIAIGLAGLMVIQGRLQASEMESYQRTQAIMLVNDMANRISTNRANAASYVIGSPTAPASIGAGSVCPDPDDAVTVQELDEAEWCNALQGAAETQSATNVGTLIGGRGCIYELAGGQEYVISVVWQGLTPISSPAVICGKESPNPFDGPAGSECVNDLCRRSFTTTVRFGNLPP